MILRITIMNNDAAYVISFLVGSILVSIILGGLISWYLALLPWAIYAFILTDHYFKKADKDDNI